MIEGEETKLTVIQITTQKGMNMGTPMIYPDTLGRILSRHEIDMIEEILLSYYYEMLDATEYIGDKVYEVWSEYNDGRIDEEELVAQLGDGRDDGLFPFHDFAEAVWRDKGRNALEDTNELIASQLRPYGIEYRYLFQLTGSGKDNTSFVLIPSFIGGSLSEEALFVEEDVVNYWHNKLNVYKQWVDTFVEQVRDAYDKYQDDILNS